MHMHADALEEANSTHTLNPKERVSTGTTEISTCLGLQASPKVKLVTIIAELEDQLPGRTLLLIATG